MSSNTIVEQAEAHLKQAEAELEMAHAAERRAEHEIDEALHEIRDASRHPDSHSIEVEVATTSGTYPEAGLARVAEQEPVENELAKAATFLRLTNTAGWIATVGGREINPKLSYEANQLKEKAVIDWGPAHGGGGAFYA